MKTWVSVTYQVKQHENKILNKIHACFFSLEIKTTKRSEASASAIPFAHNFLQSKYTFSSLQKFIKTKLKNIRKITKNNLNQIKSNLIPLLTINDIILKLQHSE